MPKRHFVGLSRQTRYTRRRGYCWARSQKMPAGLAPKLQRADPTYLPADLCLADLCAIEQRWQDMLRFANASIALDPANNFHAYFYAAGAYYGLHQLPEAETNALKAAEIDKDQREPRTHFLLAQIYELQHEPDAEAAQLREYLKSATDPQDVAMVKKYLADLTGRPRK